VVSDGGSCARRHATHLDWQAEGLWRPRVDGQGLARRVKTEVPGTRQRASTLAQMKQAITSVNATAASPPEASKSMMYADRGYRRAQP
jgi:hypothetical protein